MNTKPQTTEEKLSNWEQDFDKEYGTTDINIMAVGIVAEALSHNSLRDYGADASHITKKLIKILSLQATQVREEIITEVSMMREPMPSANDHKEYNRGMREGVELIRNAIITHLQQEKK